MSVFLPYIRVDVLKRLYSLLLLAVLLTGFCACGDRIDRTSIIISGTINGGAIDTYSDKAVMAAVTRASSFDLLSSDPLGAVVKYVAADRADRSFSIDLFGTGLAPGDQVYVLAFIDTSYSGGLPYPDVGDIIGFYTDREALSPSLTLEEGLNPGVDITINRDVFSFNSSISGVVSGNETGDLTIIVYAGEINSSDITALDVDAIIGFAEYEKGEDVLSYTIGILPYGYNIPIENTLALALLDVNQNNLMDEGDRIGYYSAQANGLPSSLTIEDGHMENVDIHFYLDVTTDSNTQEIPLETGRLSVSGNITLPDLYTPDSGSVFIVAADPDGLETMDDDPLSAVTYVKRLSPGAKSFTIDLSNSDLSPGDDVMLIGLWDRNNTGFFPDPDPGDFIGFYIDEDMFSMSYTLGSNEPESSDIHINREVFDFSAEIEGAITGNKAGDTILLAYAGEINALDFTSIDFNSVVGFKNISKPSSSIGYSLPIFPYGFNVPIEQVYILALIDNNGNGTPDAGDAIGFHTDKDRLPELITIQEGTQSEIDIDAFFDIPEPSGHEITISGNVDAPEDYYTSSSPIFIIVANTENVDDIFTDPLSTISYFEKLPEGDTGFSLDLSATALMPDDDIMLIALWDRDYSGGFPNLNPGDYIGVYFNEDTFSASIQLEQTGSSDINIHINREVFDYSAELSGTITGSPDGDIFLLAYAGEINALDFTSIDFNSVVGFKKISKASSPTEYSLPILPYGFDVPIEHVYILALIDTNENGKPDAGDAIGFHTDTQGQAPTLVTIREGTRSDIDIDTFLDIPTPSGHDIMISGIVDPPEDYYMSSSPIFIIVANTENVDDIFTDPLSAISYFEKLPEGDTRFDLDLSATALAPDDEIMLIALWDRDYDAGFPDLSEGDMEGLYQNKAESRPTVFLSEIESSIPSGEWEFIINKNVFRHNAEIAFSLEGGAGVTLTTGDPFIIVAVQKDGVDDTWPNLFTPPSYDITDMDYIIGVQPMAVNEENNYSLGILPAIYEGINVPDDSFSINDVYVFAVLDTNLNGTPDEDEDIGFYWQQLLLFRLPDTVNITDGVNTLDKTVWFSY